MLSSHHIHRSRIMNELLLEPRLAKELTLCGRSSFDEWCSKVLRPHNNVTCSLNGTFSFQTFMPMLGGAYVYTDPISKANWIGSVLASEVNCIIYNSSSEIAEHYLHRNKFSSADSIGLNAHNTVANFLVPLPNLQQRWYHEVPSERILYTQNEVELRELLLHHKTEHNLDDLISLVNIFEAVQELHRLHWLIEAEVKISFGFDGQRAKARAISKQKVFQSMLGILPRCQQTRKQLETSQTAASDQTEIKLAIKVNNKIIYNTNI